MFDGLTLGPRRNQAPAHHHSFCLAVVYPDGRHVLLRRDVKFRRELPPRLRRQELAFRGDLVRKDVTITHRIARLRPAANRSCDAPLVLSNSAAYSARGD